MTVVSIEENEDDFFIFTKGPPDNLKEICNVRSLPRDFETVLDNYSKRGRIN